MSREKPHSTELEIRLFGPLFIQLDGTRFDLRQNSDTRHLLTYLLVHRDQPLNRRTIANDLWPDHINQLDKLRKALYALGRTQYGARCIDIADNHLRWRSPATFALDIAQFERARAKALTAIQQQAWRELRFHLHVALTCYRDGFAPMLEGDWANATRWQFRRHFVALLEDAVSGLQSAGRSQDAILYAQRLIDLDPLDERPYRTLMALYAELGRLTDVKALYYRLHDQLQLDDPENEISQETEQLYGEALTGPAVLARRSITVDSTPPANLIGRSSAWTFLCDAWRQIAEGGTACWLISGEIGVGKTYLAATFAHQLTAQGVIVLSARCFDGDETDAYTHIFQWLRDPQLADTLQRLPTEQQQELVRFKPALLEQNPALKMPPAVSFPYQKRLMYEAIYAAFAELDRPIVLVLDDMHWLDRDTAAWLRFALQQPAPSNPFVLLGTARHTELLRSTAFAAWIQTLERDRLFVQVQLERLSRTATSALIEQMAAGRLDARQQRRLIEVTEGNPLFVVEYLRAGIMHVDGGDSVPQLVENVVQRHLGFVLDADRILVRFAAVLGREFDYELLQWGLEMSLQAVATALGRLTDLGVLRHLSGTTYLFRHGLIRDVVYASLQGAERHYLHGRAAYAYEQHLRTDIRQMAAVVAEHFAQARAWQSAIHYHTLAGNEAYADAAYETARIHYQNAQKLIGHVHDREAASRLEAECFLQLGKIALVTEESPATESAHCFQRALAAADGRVGLQIAALRGLWEATHNAARLDEAETHGNRLLDIAQERGEALLLQEAFWCLGATRFYQGRFSASIAALEAGRMAHALESGQPWPTPYNTLMAIQIYLACQYQMMGHIQRSRQTLKAAETLAHSQPQSPDDVYFRTHRLIYAFLDNDTAYGTVHAQSAQRLAQSMGVPMGILCCQVMQVYFTPAGDIDDARLRKLEALLADRRKNGFIGRSNFLACLAHVRINQGALTRAQILLNAGFDIVAQCGDAFMLSMLHHEQARLYQRAGAPSPDIVAAYQRGIDTAESQNAPYLALRVAIDYADFLAAIERADEAVPLLHSLLQRVENVDDDFHVATARRFLAS